MSRIVLVHWNAAEAEERAARLGRAGHEVRCHSRQGGEGWRELREDPPEAFVIDLGRLPSHGRHLAVALRQHRATRSVPIVFVGGEPEKVERARELLPDAVFCDWRQIRGALGRGVARPPAAPLVPDLMRDYAASPLVKKLGIGAGMTVRLTGAPAGFEETLGSLPEGAVLTRSGRGGGDVVMLFVATRAELGRRFAAAARMLAGKGKLWVAWPKKASGRASDVDQAAVRAFGLAAGWVDYKICAIDATWSGLCFARRGAGRPGRG